MVARMLQHLYALDYPGNKIDLQGDLETSHVSELYTHAQMYALADEYDIKDLKDEALWKFNQVLVSKKGHSDELQTVLETIPLIYSTTLDSDRGLRDIVVIYGATNLEQIKDFPEFKSAATQAPIYVVEVLPKFLKRIEQEGGRREPCRYCWR